ncbi:MAG: hypothetical protein JJU11_13055 [Candidatus Sumerlaeia bacterium]|nr:hypothetical protein [Candidatus Sumerlaeia bacterium]
MSDDQNSGIRWKIGGLSVLMLGCGIYMYAQYSTYTGGLPEEAPNRFVEQEQRRPEFNRENRPNPGERMREMADSLNLTPEQRQRMEQAQRDMGSNPGEGFRAMQEILTPEQREQAAALREERGAEWRGRMAERMARSEQEAREALSPQEFRQWQEMREERMNQRRERFAEGGGAPWGERGRGSGNQ